jgi:ketosteroid isomerase-like protein
MSQENVQITRENMEAFNRREIDAFLASLHPDVEWDDSNGFPGLQGVYRGRAGVRSWLEAFMEAWESFHGEVEQATEGSDGRVLLQMAGIARGRASGVETELCAWFVLWIADGKITKRQVFFNRDEALEAAGLSE